MLRALASEIPPGERIAALESEYELYLHETRQHSPAAIPDRASMPAGSTTSEGAGSHLLS
jgi:hypothetical protein